MKHELQLVLSPEEAGDSEQVKLIASQQLFTSPSEISFIRILKRSVDARSRNIKINLKIEV